MNKDELIAKVMDNIIRTDVLACQSALIDALLQRGDIDGFAIDDIQNNAKPHDIMGWWLISSRLCEDMREIGQPVLDNGYGHWWGRTCFGQGLDCDYVFREIAQLIVDRTFI